ncbi:MAG: CheR family methyltransferase [Candidatus Thiodiazotropha sp.]
MNGVAPIRDDEFNQFRRLIYEAAGISMAPEKKLLVASRLGKRVSHYGLDSFGEYFNLVTSKKEPGEFQILVDLLTTNETYFFREPQHFEFLEQVILKQWRGQQFRVWSAGCSSGEEVYTLAMVLTESLRSNSWEVVGSDISSRMIDKCNSAVYPVARLENMPGTYLKKYCLKGVRKNEGMILIDRTLRNHCRFKQINLMENLPDLGKFDVIFIRNVMIYFDSQTKKAVIGRLARFLKPGGYLLISHSETLHGLSDRFSMVKPSIYRLRG